MTGQDPQPTINTGGGGGDLISGIINAGAAIYASEVSRQNTKKTIQANKEQAEYAYNKDLEMWNRQNDYNDPASQMARMKAAGINPHAPYASGGSGGAGNAAQMPKYNAPTLQYNYQPINIPAVLGAYQEFRMKQAQIDNLKANEQKVRAQTLTEASRNTLIGAQGDVTRTKAYTSNYAAPYQNAIIHNQAQMSEAKLKEEWQKLRLLNQQEVSHNLNQQYMQKKMDLTDIDREKREAELVFQKYKNDWTKAGITSGDNIMLRVLVRMFNESGLNAGDLFK